MNDHKCGASMYKLIKKLIVITLITNIFILFTAVIPIRYVSMQYIAEYDGDVKIYLDGYKGYNEWRTCKSSSEHNEISFVAVFKEIDNIRIDFEAITKKTGAIYIKSIRSSSIFFDEYLDVNDVILSEGTLNNQSGNFCFTGDDPSIIIKNTEGRMYYYDRIIFINCFVLLFSFIYLKKNVLKLRYHVRKIVQKVIYDNTSVLKYYKDTSYLKLGVIIILIVAYGFKVFNLGISIDTDVAYEQVSNYYRLVGWASQGRFGIGIMKVFSPNVFFVPYISNVLAVMIFGYAALSWNYVLDKYLFENNNKLIGMIFVGLFLTCPSYAETMNFPTYNLEVTVGVLLLSFSVKHLILFLNSSIKTNFIISVLLLIFTISIYQSFILFYLSISVLIIFMKNDNTLKVRNSLLVLSKISVISIIVYLIINSMVQLYIPKSEYIEGFFRWGKLTYSDIYLNVFHYIGRFFTGNLYCGSNVLIFSMFACILCIIVDRKKFWLLLLYLFEIVPVIILGGDIPIRSNFVIMWINTIPICMLLYVLCNKYKKIYQYFVLVSMCVIFYQMSTVSYLMHGEYIKSQNDYYMMQRIGFEIEDVENSFIKKYKEKPYIAFIGERVSKVNSNVTYKGEVIGRSFFEWRDPIRLIRYMNLIGHDFRYANNEDLKRAKKMAEDMPIWPDKDSIQIRENLIIVKFSDGYGEWR